MKRVILTSIIFFLLFLPLGLAENLNLLLKIYANDTVELLNASVATGVSSFQIPGNYTLSLLSKEGRLINNVSFNVDFTLYSSVPILLNETFVYISVPYQREISRIEIYKGSILIFKKELAFCNHNKACDMRENFYTCPSDCPSGSLDGICDALIDDKCDPDCREIDVDCKEELKISIKKQSSQIQWIYYGLIVGAIVIIVVLVLILYRRKPKETFQQNLNVPQGRFSKLGCEHFSPFSSLLLHLTKT